MVLEVEELGVVSGLCRKAKGLRESIGGPCQRARDKKIDITEVAFSGEFGRDADVGEERGEGFCDGCAGEGVDFGGDAGGVEVFKGAAAHGDGFQILD